LTVSARSGRAGRTSSRLPPSSSGPGSSPGRGNGEEALTRSAAPQTNRAISGTFGCPFRCPGVVPVWSQSHIGAEKVFAEPVALSSTQPTDVPLPRTAARLGLDLITLRARRKRKATRSDTSAQDRREPNSLQFARGTRAPRSGLGCRPGPVAQLVRAADS
jgi:hypothetical protein